MDIEGELWICDRCGLPVSAMKLSLDAKPLIIRRVETTTCTPSHIVPMTAFNGYSKQETWIRQDRRNVLRSLL